MATDTNELTDQTVYQLKCVTQVTGVQSLLIIRILPTAAEGSRLIGSFISSTSQRFFSRFPGADQWTMTWISRI
jgi:hypothetical protein